MIYNKKISIRASQLKKWSLGYILISVILITIGLKINFFVGVYSLITLMVIFLYEFTNNYFRYLKIEDLSFRIQNIIENREEFDLGDEAFTEIYNLENDIYSLSLRLKKQEYIIKKNNNFFYRSILDLNNNIKKPLVLVNKLVEKLSSSNLSDMQRLEIIRELRNIVPEIEWFIDKFIKLNRIENTKIEYKKEEFDLLDLIKKTIIKYETQIQLQQIRFEFKNEIENIKVLSDYEWIEEAFLNITKYLIFNTKENEKILINIMKNNERLEIYYHIDNEIKEEINVEIELAKKILKKNSFELKIIRSKNIDNFKSCICISTNNMLQS